MLDAISSHQRYPEYSPKLWNWITEDNYNYSMTGVSKKVISIGIVNQVISRVFKEIEKSYKTIYCR